MPSLKKNIVFNYIGQFYVAFIGVLILPLYLRYLGAEAYGLVGFFTLLQSWMQLLDIGVSPTLGREIAHFKSVKNKAVQLRSVVRSLETIFACIACLTTLSVFLSREWLAKEWLTIHELDLQLVASCIGLMALMIGIRWLASLHRSGINAFEQQVWMNVVDILLVTLRFPGSLLLIVWSNSDLLLFFSYQLALIILEQLLISLKFYSLLPQVKQAISCFSIAEVKRIAPFALGIAYTGGIWIFVTQLDKLLLSKILSLAEYGYFTLIAIISGGVMLLSGPISKAILPRMTSLLAQGMESEMLSLYRKSTRFVVCIVAPVTLVLAFFPKEVVYIWTGDAKAADWTTPILPMFILGNGLLAIGAFQYYLQYAHGKLRQHVIYNTASALVSIPLITYAALNHGPIGVAWAWLFFRLFSLIVWTPYVHHVFAPGLHKDWILKDVLSPIMSSVVVLVFLFSILQQSFPIGRFEGFLVISGVTLLTIVIAFFTSFYIKIREQIRAKFRLR